MAASGITASFSGAKKTDMGRLGTLLDYALWPGLLGASCLGLGVGIAHGRGPLAFNLAYLGLALTATTVGCLTSLPGNTPQVTAQGFAFLLLVYVLPLTSTAW